jgi:hypothetical protein
MGIVPSVAAMLGLKAACILATMPVYASGIYYPKACLALLEGIERLLHMHFDHGELERVIEELETLYNQVEEKIREQFPTILTLAEPPYDSEEEVEERALAEATDLPQPVIIKIEKLFKEAANDRLKAVELKRVLDRHGIFKKYEDRFLDLFSEPEGDTEIR